MKPSLPVELIINGMTYTRKAEPEEIRVFGMDLKTVKAMRDFFATRGVPLSVEAVQDFSKYLDIIREKFEDAKCP